MTWRLPNEGLTRTTKGRKEGSGGRMANFFVAISHGRGVTMCKHYTWTVTGETFCTFVKHCFPVAFEKCGVRPDRGMFLQDGDPRQNSALARNAWQKLGCEMFPIPPRSPDLNPIENLFHLVRKKLKKDAIDNNITKETYNNFSKRVAKTISEFPAETINNLIESMPKRLQLVVNGKGSRTKY